MIGSKGLPASHVRGAGGIETHVEELAVRLSERGHHVSVYVRAYSNPQKLRTYRGVRLITIPSIATKNFDTITYSLLATFHVLSQNADVIHFHGVGPATLAWIPRVFKYRSRIVSTFHSRDRFHHKWGVFARAYLAFGEWACVTFPHRTIAVSHVIQRFCVHLFGAKHVVYIPNGVEIPEYVRETKLIRSFGLESGEYFFTLTRLTGFKRIEDAIKAFRHVKTTKKLVIVGEGSHGDEGYEAWLKRMAAPDPRIIFIGKRQHHEVAEIISHGYAMIHPSAVEGLSVAILESMASGRLVIMSDIPENLELVDHSAIAYPVKSIEALTTAIQTADDDSTMVKERGLRAKEVIRKLYTWDRIIDKTEALYQDINL